MSKYRRPASLSDFLVIIGCVLFLGMEFWSFGFWKGSAILSSFLIGCMVGNWLWDKNHSKK